jgi:probable HAF family extracellular repeat protein
MGQKPHFGWPESVVGTLGGNLASARALNDNDEVVGYSEIKSNVEAHGFYWKSGTNIVDLDSSLTPGTVWLFNRADGINAEGYIVGTGRNGDFRIRGAILMPVDIILKPTISIGNFDYPRVIDIIMRGLHEGTPGFHVPGPDPGPERDVLISLSIHFLASLVSDAKMVRLIQRSALRVAAEQIEQMLKQASVE